MNQWIPKIEKDLKDAKEKPNNDENIQFLEQLLSDKKKLLSELETTKSELETKKAVFEQKVKECNDKIRKLHADSS